MVATLFYLPYDRRVDYFTLYLTTWSPYLLGIAFCCVYNNDDVVVCFGGERKKQKKMEEET